MEYSIRGFFFFGVEWGAGQPRLANSIEIFIILTRVHDLGLRFLATLWPLFGFKFFEVNMSIFTKGTDNIHL